MYMYMYMYMCNVHVHVHVQYVIRGVYFVLTLTWEDTVPAVGGASLVSISFSAFPLQGGGSE